MPPIKPLPSLPRTVAACVAAAGAVGLPLAVWQAGAESQEHPAAGPGVAVGVGLFVAALTAAVGGIAGCVVYAGRTAARGDRR